MLAQSFLTAAELNLPEEAVTALQKVLVLLETEKLQFFNFPRGGVPGFQIVSIPTPADFTGLFSMNSWANKGPCGTVGCIGGTAEMISGVDMRRLASTRNQMRNLFYPPTGDTPYSEITMAQAAQALRNYLTTGKPNWSQILA